MLANSLQIKKATHDITRKWLIIKSGRQDSNLRPPAPKAGTLTGLRYAPNKFLLGKLIPDYPPYFSQYELQSGERGIRTPGTG